MVWHVHSQTGECCFGICHLAGFAGATRGSGPKASGAAPAASQGSSSYMKRA